MVSTTSTAVQIDINDSLSLADTLKRETQVAHTRAEQHNIQARFVRGTVTRAEYCIWLQQMLPVWQALDAALIAFARVDVRIADIFQPYHTHAPRIEADLAFLGEHPDAGAIVPATSSFVSLITDAAAGEPCRLLGIWYVLEGSANGGRYIARALARSLSIDGPQGLASFDPHGELQRPRWQAWRATLDSQHYTAAERNAILGAAGAAFDAVYAIMQNLEEKMLSGSPID